MRTRAVVFPFDLFGSGGTAAGAQLLGDALKEVIDDTRQETRPVRQKAFAESLTIDEVELHSAESIAAWRSLGTAAFRKAAREPFTLWLSGNHLGCLPVYDELPAGSLIIQLDAHLDCYHLHDTHATLSNGNFLRHRAAGGAAVVNLGHRDLFLDAKSIRRHFTAAHSAEALAMNEPSVLADVQQRADAAEAVWLDLDADAFDPAISPAVHAPLPGGLCLPQVMRIVNAIGPARLRGVSISEFDPGRDRSDISLNLLGWLLEWLLLKKAEVC